MACEKVLVVVEGEEDKLVAMEERRCPETGDWHRETGTDSGSENEPASIS
jgi:hypothetical protein